nr:hypothetical protein [Sedimentibacter sp.]
MIYSSKPYRAENLLFKKTAVNNEVNDDSTAEAGFLEVYVFDSKTHEPIGCAMVEISKIMVTGPSQENAEGRVIYRNRTDSNGNVSNIELPELNELMPNNYDYYAIAIVLDEYYSAYIFRVQIYPGITARYNIYLTHRSVGENKFSFTIQPTVEEEHELR